MQLFRHHTARHQRNISDSNDFVCDSSRRFNHTGRVKNSAHFYFYALTLEGAEMYKDEDTILFEYYTTATRILDLRVTSNRELLTNTIAALKSMENEIRASIRKVIPTNLQGIAMHDASDDDIINDVHCDGHTLWGQRASDFECGIALKNDLIRLGYQGVLFQQYKHPEIGLLNAAIPK